MIIITADGHSFKTTDRHAATGMLLVVLPSVLSARVVFATTLAFSDLYHFASYGGHTGFILLYVASAMVLPADSAGRGGCMRWIVAHQLGSSGLHKLLLGGRAWLHPSTMRFTLKFLYDCAIPFKPHFLVEPPWLKQRWLIEICLRRSWLLGLLAAGGFALEMAVPLGCLLGGPLILRLVAFACCAFHVVTALLMGIFFPFSIPCYLVALLPPAAHDPLCLASPPALVAALCLGASMLLSLEDWPLNAMALFPWNAAQQKALQARIGRCALTHCDADKSSTTPPFSGTVVDIAEVASSACPANYYPGFPEHERARENPETLLAPSEASAVAAEMRVWLRATRRFVDARADSARRGLCFDDVVEL